MSYYAGDFYASGDPGFFSAIGRLVKKVLPVAAGFIPGGGALATVVKGAAGGLARRGVRAAVAHPVITATAAAGAAAAGGLAIHRMGSPAAAGMSMANRRMRVTNPRALRRAIRRATGFAKLARRVLHFTSPRPPRGRAIFRRKRTKRV